MKLQQGGLPLTAEQRRDLLEIVDDRYEKGSLLITSQIPSADGTKLSGTCAYRKSHPGWHMRSNAVTLAG